MEQRNRKYYAAPTIEVIRLDKEICLFMATTPPPNPTGAAPIGEPSPFDLPLSAPPSSNHPFGGDKPDYSNM